MHGHLNVKSSQSTEKQRSKFGSYVKRMSGAAGPFGRHISLPNALLILCHEPTKNRLTKIPEDLFMHAFIM